MSKKQSLYLGKAGHLVVMAEFLLRGWNVAIPEVDVGDDVYVVEDGRGSLKELQVKTVTASMHKNGFGFSGKFTLKNDQLLGPSSSRSFVFIVRHSDQWSPPVIIAQATLRDELDRLGMVLRPGKSLNLTLRFQHDKVHFRDLDWSSRLKDFTDFPVIQH